MILQEHSGTELIVHLVISDDCTKEDGARCINGACLNGVCHCNDGFGGCNCQEQGTYIFCCNYLRNCR